jgi:cysteinylglycine-S-conjugate dipeptidase
MPLAETANNLLAEATASVDVRLAPGQDPAAMWEPVRSFLAADPPWGVEVDLRVGAEASGWSVESEGPAFEAAERALEQGYGGATIDLGCGGGIPFVRPFAEVLGGAPAFLLGLEDLICNAHGANESLGLADFLRAMRSAAVLFKEIAETTDR